MKDATIALTSYDGQPLFEEWHAHNNASLSFLLSGTHEEDLLGKKLKRVPGDLKFIPAGEQHRCYLYAPGTRKINLDICAEVWKRMEIGGDDIAAALRYSLNPKFTLLKLYHELSEQNSAAQLSAELLLYELFNPIPIARQIKAAPYWVNQLKYLLHEEWNTPFGLDELARRIGVHPVTISRYFPQYFSSTLGNYIKQIKVTRALALIKGTVLPLTEIAYSCGFADQAHFTRTFKKITGYLPRDFRNT